MGKKVLQDQTVTIGGKNISVAIITLNEESRLPACLESVSFANDVVIVDSGSTDRTVEIAKSFGAKVFIERWQGFSAQKQLAVDYCINKWVLILDADERVPAGTASRIVEIIRKSGKDMRAYSLKRKNYLHNKWIKSCGWWPNRVVRLVDKTQGTFDGKSIHESWITHTTTAPLDISIDHLSFNNYSDLIHKMNHYSDLGSLALYGQTKRATPFKAIAHGLWMFFKTYFLELGITDGFDGFVISMTNAGGSFLKYAKHRELVNNPPDTDIATSTTITECK